MIHRLLCAVGPTVVGVCCLLQACSLRSFHWELSRAAEKVTGPGLYVVLLDGVLLFGVVCAVGGLYIGIRRWRLPTATSESAVFWLAIIAIAVSTTVALAAVTFVVAFLKV